VRVIKLSAVDGAGKSTVASTIASRVRRRGARVVVLHWPSDSLLGFLPDESNRGIEALVAGFEQALTLVRSDPTASELTHQSASGGPNKAGTTPPIVGTGFRYASALLFTLKFWVVLANYLFMLGYLPIRYRGVDCVVLDRCLFDDLVQLEYRGVPRPLIALGIALVTTTDQYCLEVGPRTAAARDQESDGPTHPAHYYERKTRLYRRYATWRTISRIDARAEPSIIAASIL
jgi:hypothetical protein